MRQNKTRYLRTNSFRSGNYFKNDGRWFEFRPCVFGKSKMETYSFFGYLRALSEAAWQRQENTASEVQGCGLLTTVEEPKPLTDSWDELAENSRGKEQRNSGDYIWNENCLRNIRADKRMTNTNKSAIKKLKEKTPVEGDLLLKEANYHLLKNVGEDAELLDANDTSGRQPYTASASQQPRITLVFLYLSKIFQR
ncbi:uncharacterized protein LOC143195023 isoform X3 [Rhynchophorus ferrugineus]|uniref:uncharacterized protein LOC143195023 isoform X3 n=1 Tax=Rhynchophorus ferrugineus TaxID=354439 RepID=UPI003FCD2B4C